MAVATRASILLVVPSGYEEEERIKMSAVVGKNNHKKCVPKTTEWTIVID